MVQPGAWREEAGFAQELERAGHAAATVTLGELGGGRREAFLLVFGGRKGNVIFGDVLAYDVARREWSVWCECWPFAPRSYHTAIVVDGEVWLCGGGDSSSVLGEVLVFTPASRQWRRQALRGDPTLLKRTAHGACLHPQRPHSILLMGGYGGPDDDFRYLNDLVEVDTRAGTVRALQCIGTPPDPRAYHAFVAVGQHCYVVAGRTHDNRLVKGKQMLMVFDVAQAKWITPGVVEGELAPRSSHRMVAVPGGALVFGGAIDKGSKSADLHLLVTGQGRLSWRKCPLAQGAGGGAGGSGSSRGGGTPAGRGAHAVEIVGGRLYVVGGYGGGEGKSYTADCWSLSLEAIGGCEAVAPAASPLQKDAAAKQSGGDKAAIPLPEASQWREARRSCPATTFGAGAAKRQRLAGTATAARAAAAAPAPPSALITPVAPAAAALAALVAAPAPPSAAAPLDQQQQQPLLAQQQQQPPQQQQVQLVPAAATQFDPRQAELQETLHRERVAAAAMQQQLADLMRQNGELKADVSSWRRKAEEEQQASSQAHSALQQRTAEVSDLQRQLRAAQQEVSKAESDLLEIRSEQRRDRDRAEREAMDRAKRMHQLEDHLAEQRKSHTTLSDTVAHQTQMLQQQQQQLQEKEQQLGEARVAHAQERERMTNAVQEAKDKEREAAQQRDRLQARLEAEQRALKEAREELERQQAQLRTAHERARHSDEECRKAKDEADEARGRAAAAEAAADRARAAMGRVTQAADLLRKAEEDMAAV